VNYISAIRYFRRLATLDTCAWRYLPYRAKMKLLGIDLSWVTVDQSGLSHERSHWHSDSGGPELKRLLDVLPIDDSDAVIDLGCGKGGAMFTLARYPFSRVDGVEICEHFVRIAERNLARLKITNSCVFCADAADFLDLDPYSYIYMYNPFPRRVTEIVLNNIKNSILRRSRTITVIYKNPIFDCLLLECGFKKLVQTEQEHADYPSFGVYFANGVTVQPNSAELQRLFRTSAELRTKQEDKCGI
jgi:SAM-dependent methyltransferase